MPLHSSLSHASLSLNLLLYSIGKKEEIKATEGEEEENFDWLKQFHDTDCDSLA